MKQGELSSIPPITTKWNSGAIRQRLETLEKSKVPAFFTSAVFRADQLKSGGIPQYAEVDAPSEHVMPIPDLQIRDAKPAAKRQLELERLVNRELAWLPWSRYAYCPATAT